ncbi:restriction endonuclease subunit S, partial [Rhodobacteraceae bacterium]|nr:restriction endonuclease subunit S [Paracoccaceae bacterium]
VRDVQKLLTQYRQSVLKSAVTGQLTKSDRSGWEAVELGSLLEDIRYGTAKKCSYEPANTAVLRIPNVVGGKIGLDDVKYTDLTESESEKLALELGDILIVRSNGSANLIARGAVVREEAVGMSFAGYLIRLRVDQARILPDYLQMSMASPQTRALIERQARSTSGVHNINSGEVKSIAVELPPVPEQIEIMDAVDDALQKIVDLEQWSETELKRSASLRQSILKDAFAGKLVPQDPADEPASDLLARIAAEKPTAKKPGRKTPA